MKLFKILFFLFILLPSPSNMAQQRSTGSGTMISSEESLPHPIANVETNEEINDNNNNNKKEKEHATKETIDESATQDDNDQQIHGMYFVHYVLFLYCLLCLICTVCRACSYLISDLKYGFDYFVPIKNFEYCPDYDFPLFINVAALTNKQEISDLGRSQSNEAISSKGSVISQLSKTPTCLNKESPLGAATGMTCYT